MSAVIVRDLEKRYGATVAVRGVSFTCAPGEVFGLLGPNGAGKTTTLECLLGLRTAEAGEIRLGGVDPRVEPADARARVGAVLQTTALPDRLSPREALRLFAALHRRPLARADELLREFSLVEQAKLPFHALSGGQRQRLALAVAFVHAPRILVLDEPTAGLDPASRRDLHERIRGLKQQGCCVILSTHDMAEAHRLCDRLAILDGGCIVASGTPEGMIARSGALATVRLLTEPTLPSLAFSGIEGVVSCHEEAGTTVIRAAAPHRVLAAIVQHASSAGCEVRELQVMPPTLEDAFLGLTGRAWSASHAPAVR